MKRFQGVLLISDYDNSLVYTAGFRPGIDETPCLSQESKELLHWFMAEGGSFAVATGRSLSAFWRFAPEIPTNMPTILFNGAAIYDFKTRHYVRCINIDRGAQDAVSAICKRHPELAAEFYGEGMEYYLCQPNKESAWHAATTQQESIVIDTVEEAPGPFVKLLLSGPHDSLLEAQKEIPTDYNAYLSAECLLEITDKRANKGDAAHYLLKRWGLSQEHLYCMGDQKNDLPMLEMAAEAFAPDNAVPALHREDITLVSDCRDHALRDVIERLKERYPEV